MAGDTSMLRNISTSDFNVARGVASIADPSEINLASRQCIALPFHVPDVCNSKSLHKIEIQCFKEFHLRCLLSTMNKKHYKAFLLELVLAENSCLIRKSAL